ncbi:MAG: hypothetical protein D3923_18920, partial [Candidatus Electrothrix sp. AR3]|nr:hypothetical protein [Candidatus Electrothrix sp. AR3]
EKQVLVGFFAEDFFESVIGEEVDVAFFGGHRVIGSVILLQEVSGGLFSMRLLYPIVMKWQIGKEKVVCPLIT